MALEIEIFTLSSRMISLDKHKASLCIMDERSALSDLLNERLASVAHLSETAISEKGIDLSDFQKSFECEVKAQVYELKALPAIVFDRQYVVYGIDHLDEAIRLKGGVND